MEMEEGIEKWNKSKSPVMDQVGGAEEEPQVDKNKVKVVELAVWRG